MASDGIRVGALGSSPLRDLSHALEERAQELETLISGLDEVIAEQTAERTRVRLALAQAEEVRAQIMEHRRLVRPEVLAGALRRSGELYARMRSLDSRLAGLEERLTGMRSERDQLGQIRPLAEELGIDLTARSVTADDPQVVCRRAERQLQRLVMQDHEAITDMIMSGPLEDLADVVLAVELIGRRVGRAPALTVTSEITQCKEVTRRAMARMDRLLFQISPQGLEEEGLVTSVRRAGADLLGIVTVRVQVVGEERHLPLSIAMAAFRVVVEAIDNAYRHGRAEEVEVVVAFLPRRLQVVVGDHGEGFDVGATEARLGRTRSLGLISMRERVENVRGSFEIRSALGAGTEVRAVFDTA
ncbi:MAG: ATP-binding protein [Candidatus Dormibacteria bacterium]|jgi:two-component system sensor histidine kinase DegS